MKHIKAGLARLKRAKDEEGLFRLNVLFEKRVLDEVGRLLESRAVTKKERGHKNFSKYNSCSYHRKFCKSSDCNKF